MNGQATHRAGHGLTRGFTLIETILVIGVLALAATVIAKMQSSVFKTQENGRDQYVGVELQQACAERLLTVRRRTGLGSVTNTLCNGIGGVGGFAANPTVTLNDGGTPNASQCGIAQTCTAVISIAKASGPPASLAALTIEFKAY